MDTPKIIYEREPVTTNKYVRVFSTTIFFGLGFIFIFKHLPSFVAILSSIGLLAVLILIIYIIIKYPTKILIATDKEITFYGRPKTLTLPIPKIRRIRTSQKYWNKLTATVKLEIETDNQTFNIITRCFDFDKLELIMLRSNPV